MSGCTTEAAKGFVFMLIGDAEATAPGPKAGRPGRPYFHHFASMDALSARLEYEQVKQLPLHDRERDLIERMGLDGRSAPVEGGKGSKNAG